MQKNLSSIKSEFKNEIIQFEKTFAEVLTSNYRLIDTIVKYIIKNKGKGLRPLLVLMSARLIGEPVPETYLAASTVELLHTASLIHDDVVDEAGVRRGFPTINALWKNKVAVLMGDYLLSKCLIGATMTGSLEIMQILANASRRLSKGELMQIEKARKLNVSEEEYFEIISDKTAALISASTELGALTVSKKQWDRENLKNFGENLGIAFQIKDDLLDYYGHQVILGKPVGNDFKDKKITLPLIYAFQQSGNGDIQKIKKMLKKGVALKDVKYIISFVEKNGGVEYATHKQNEYSSRAKACLNEYPDNSIKTALIEFVDYAIQRTR